MYVSHGFAPCYITNKEVFLVSQHIKTKCRNQSTDSNIGSISLSAGFEYGTEQGFKTVSFNPSFPVI